MIAIVSIVCALMGLALGYMIAKVKISQQLGSVKADLRVAENSAAVAERLLGETKASAAQQLEAFKKQHEADFARQLETMKTQFQAVSENLLKTRSDELKGTNKEQMEAITKPLHQVIEEMRKQLGETKEGSDKNMAALGEAFTRMMNQTVKLGKDAENLADALKNRGKVQGDWGEQILCNILQDSNLREGEEFFTQKSYTGQDGKEYRPDVVVKSADESMIIVDSKVSLTAYSNYVSAKDDAEREQACKENYASVWSHVEELAAKNYPKHVPNALPYVLMFVPNEGSYILAMNHDPQVGIKAYKKGVLIVNATNLMMALSLILFTWKNTRQEENCARIMKAAEDLYEKFCTFSETFVRVGNQFETARKSYDEAKGQLKDGRGSIISKFAGMQQLGLTTTKTISEKLQN
ncbi:DNA recombination protein RmuC [Fibrobacter sp. UWEL]|uniref:DNA recombination protein RmuC n=1 Tax=Fibrobacter sp. UWEL TaxID=1896209 RepID=UPI00091528E5|nr:DNA recombination protein RmuC [Fibrobacter sp. UWEL]SHL34694.1 DNA recombination protein RmuC [Fibrobacter sp. UWEL]